MAKSLNKKISKLSATGLSWKTFNEINYKEMDDNDSANEDQRSSNCAKLSTTTTTQPSKLEGKRRLSTRMKKLNKTVHQTKSSSKANRSSHLDKENRTMHGYLNVEKVRSSALRRMNTLRSSLRNKFRRFDNVPKPLENVATPTQTPISINNRLRRSPRFTPSPGMDQYYPIGIETPEAAKIRMGIRSTKMKINTSEKKRIQKDLDVVCDGMNSLNRVHARILENRRRSTRNTTPSKILTTPGGRKTRGRRAIVFN